MTPFTFYFWFTFLVELVPVIPIVTGLVKWRILSDDMRYFIGFILVDFLLNILGDYYYFFLYKNNLFLNYIYSFSQCNFILLFYFTLFEVKVEKRITLTALVLCNFSLIMDFLFVSKEGYNYMSAMLVDLIIFFVSVYFFSTKIINTKYVNSYSFELKLIVSLVVLFQFFIKAIVVFIEKFLLETQYDAILWLQIRDVYSFFMLISVVIYAYVLYNIKSDGR